MSDNDNANDRNRIEVTATKLAFSTVSDGSINIPLSSFNISALDDNSNTDKDATGAVSISTSGSGMSGNTGFSLSAGTVSVNTVQFNGVQGPITLSAISGSLSGTSNAFNIVLVSYAYNSFLSITGSGSYTSTSSWSKCGNVGGCTGTTIGTGGWSAVGAGTPTSASTIFVQGVITNTASNGAANATILSGGELIVSNNYPISNSILIKSGGKFRTNYGAVVTVAPSATLTVEDNGNLYINTAFTNPTISIWNGIENFYPKSNLYINNWRADGTNRFLVNNDVTANTHNEKSAIFGNVYIDAIVPIINSANNAEITDINNNGFGGGNWSIIGPNNVSPLNLTHGDFVFVNAPQNVSSSCSCGSGTPGIKIPRFLSSGTPANFQINMLGDLKTEASWLFTATFSSVGNVALNVNKNLILDSGTFAIRGASGTNDAIINVGGNIVLNGNSTLSFNTQSYTNPNGDSILNLQGDLNAAASANISTGSPMDDAIFNFTGIGEGLSDATTQTIDVKNPATAAKINFNVNSGAYVKLINQDLALGSSSSFNVKNGGTLDFGFSPSNLALNITNYVNTATFKTEANSTIKITSPEGITNTTGTGNVRTMTTGRVFDKSATYHYVGKVNQATGNGIPDQITGKLIVELETQNATQDDLEFRSTGTTTFGTTGGVNGILEIRKGKVFDDPSKGFRNYNGTVDENNDGEADVQKGDLVMKGGKYVVSGGGFKPSLSGNYTLDSGTVEFAGNSNTKIRVKPAYFNVDVSGSNVTPGGKNLVVNNELKVISATAVLTIPEVSDNENPYVVTAKKGIQIAEGGEAIFKNNAILMQEKDAVNTGNITMERKATVPSVQYNYWSSPVKDQPLYSLYPGIPDNKVMVYNSANDRFTVLPTSSNPKSVFAKGYSIKGSSNTDYAPALTATFIGEPHNETTAVTNSILLSTAGSNYNLIGNPYPSNLNLLDLFGDEDNKGKFYNVNSGPDIETPTAYFWDNTSNTDLTQQGSGYINMNYALLNLSNGIGTPAPRLATTGKKPNGIVKPGQGFIMRAAESGGSLTFKNTHRTTLTKPSGGTEGVYYKANEATTDKFWLTLTTPNQMNIVIALAYHPEAENSFERFDSMIFSEAVTENFYSVSSDGRKLAIQSRKGDFNTEDKIPLGIKSSETGLQKISLESNYGVFENQPIYLKDKLLNTVVNLSEMPYEFTSVEGVDQNRFEIVYKPGTVLATDSGIKETLTVYRNANDFVVKSKHSRIDEVEVYDVSGRLIIKVKGGSDELRIDASSYISGTYVLKIKCDEKTVTKKILK